MLARLVEEVLELGLVAEPLERLGADALDLRAGLGLRERGQRRDAGRLEALRVQAPEPGDDDEVVVVDAPLVAEVAEVADARSGRTARGTWSGSAASAARKRSRERRKYAMNSAVRNVSRSPVPSSTWMLLRQPPLDPLELGCVEAELEQVAGLRGAGELRVHGLVRAVRLALEEVGEPAPACRRRGRPGR